MAKSERERLNLPERPFLYTLDQIGVILSIQEASLVSGGYVFFVGRQPGNAKPDELRAHNVALPDQPPNWRIEEKELIRWMKRKGFRYIDR